MLPDSDDLDGIFAKQDEDAMVEMACAVVNIPSPTGEEGPLADYVGGRFADLGLDVEYQEVESERRNVLARLDGEWSGPTIMMLAHLDTSTTPGERLPMGFQAKAVVRDGWIYGLGVSNMKCAFAAYYSALQMLRDAGVDLPARLVMAGVVGEIEKAPVDEWTGVRYRGGGSGARFMLNHGVRADFCLNGEPTGLRLQLGNAGYVFARVRVEGKPQATFSREAAVDPLPKAYRLHELISGWEAEYQAEHPHPVMKPLVSVGAIYGGYPFKPGITAPFCTLYVHVTTVPGQDINSVQRGLEGVVARAAEEDPALSADVSLYLVSNGHLLDEGHPGAAAVEAAHRSVTGRDVVRPNPERYSISSDNSPLAEFGVPGITYGAGGINTSGGYTVYEPGVGELVSVDNLRTCARVYVASILELCRRWDPAARGWTAS